MKKEVILDTMLSSKQLTKLHKASKALRNRRVKHLLESLSAVGEASRRDLKKHVKVGDSTLSGYLSALEDSSLVNTTKMGRQVNVQITPLGRRLVDFRKDLGMFAHIASDRRRVRLMELIAGNGGRGYTEIYYLLNRLLASAGEHEITTALMGYHLRILRKKSIIQLNSSSYHMSKKGRKLLKAACSLFP